MADEKKIEMEGQESFAEVKESDSQQQDVVEALGKAVDNAGVQDEEEEKDHLVMVSKRLHASHTERKTVRSLLQMYADHKIVLPIVQRLYVWDKKKRDDLMDSIERGFLCGSVELATLEGGDDTQYLCDGLQRIVSLLLMTNDEALTTEQKTKVLNFKISTEVVYDLNIEEMSIWFLRLNSGVVVASAVKERSKLSESLNEAILNVSGNQFFRDISEKANATFKKSHHHEIIAENILLACAGVKIGSNKAKDLCKRIQEYEADIKANAEKANTIVDNIETIYDDLNDDIIKRSMNANFVSVLVYIMVEHDNIKLEQYKELIQYVFANKRAIKEYSNTTHGAAASEEQIKARYEVIMNLLNNPPKVETHEDEMPKVKEPKSVVSVEKPSELSLQADDEAYHKFCQSHTGRVLNTRGGDYPVEFNDMTEQEHKNLYQYCDIEPNKNKYEGVLIKAFNRVEKIKPDKKESA